jgi:hypothetical protein
VFENPLAQQLLRLELGPESQVSVADWPRAMVEGLMESVGAGNDACATPAAAKKNINEKASVRKEKLCIIRF